MHDFFALCKFITVRYLERKGGVQNNQKVDYVINV